MKRNEFLKLIGTGGLGAPFFLNGLSANAMNNFFDIPLACDGVSERVLVIVRLAGANDGLNTIIPISQYRTYADIRPNIRIQETGANAYLNLDSTLPDEKKSGLHPVMTAFKSLYDNGKLSLINGVGYPSPNRSHFTSTDLMYAGRDGTTSSNRVDGIFGRYIESFLPGLAGNPTMDNPHPLVVHLGNSNPVLFYGHTENKNIEYNATAFQNTFNTTLGTRLPSPTVSEYNALLDYITNAQLAMDVYYNAVFSAFNGGSNSTITYPNTDLAKQLKTVARLIKGGSKTKIFQVNLGSFDTHSAQAVSGAAHTGTHATLLANLADSVAAFQSDIESLGFADKVMTVTFSEFGRTIKENGNRGTDHGDLSPFFVIGTNAQAGVIGSHPTLTNSTETRYSETERKHDYRQLFATLMQDWLGANNQIMTTAELGTFAAAAQKLPVIKSTANADTNGCLLGNNPLPLDLLSFNASQIENYVQLTWKTANEKNFSHFEIQKSVDAKEFGSFAIVKGSQSAVYNQIDAKPSEGDNYYRLKIVNSDGTTKFSSVINIRFENGADFVTFENPAINGEFKLNTNLIDPNFSLLNSSGTKINLQINKKENNSYYMRTQALPGIYFLIIESDKKVITKKLVISQA